jgi:hypothetical protein
MIHLNVNPPGRSRNVTTSCPNRRSKLARKHAGSPNRRVDSRAKRAGSRAQIILLCAVCSSAGAVSGRSGLESHDADPVRPVACLAIWLSIPADPGGHPDR